MVVSLNAVSAYISVSLSFLQVTAFFPIINKHNFNCFHSDPVQGEREFYDARGNLNLR